METYDAIVVGAGPNGLSAAVTLALAGCKVLVREAMVAPGGGARSEQLTLPGFVHDTCSAVHPMAMASPVFRAFGLERFGLVWVQPETPLLHVVDDTRVVALEHSIEATARGLGRDAGRYSDVMEPLTERLRAVLDSVPTPRRLLLQAFRFVPDTAALLAPAMRFVTTRFEERETRALFAGLAAHGMIDLTLTASNAVGLVLAAMAHIVGWPVARGGSQRITEALVACLRAAGGELVTSAPVTSLAELPAARAVLLDTSPAAFVAMAGARLSRRGAAPFSALRRGMAVHKVDWALEGEIPWRDPACVRAGTLHIGGTADEVAAAERDAWEGRVPPRPFMLVAQPSHFDPTRAPAGGSVVWAYAHVPLGCADDVTARIEDRIEQLAPGFRERVRARHVMTPRELEAHNPNLALGDISGGAMTLAQMLRRPTSRLWSTPLAGVYLCSASTPPGPGVHGLCGYLAARRALAERFGRRFLTNLDAKVAESLRPLPRFATAAGTHSPRSGPNTPRSRDARATS